MDDKLRDLNDWVVDDLDDPRDAGVVFDLGLEDVYGLPTEPPDDQESEEYFGYMVGQFYKALGIANLTWALPRAESPIEKIFLFHLVCAFWQYDPHLLSPPLEVVVQRLAGVMQEDEPAGRAAAEWLDRMDIEQSIVFVPQLVPEDWPEGRSPFDEDDPRLEELSSIRLDLVLARPHHDQEFLAVECDGYEWHKDNFTDDRQRDRLLRQAGFDVLRYSGSEIVNGPGEAARDCRDYCIDKWGDMPDQEG